MKEKSMQLDQAFTVINAIASATPSDDFDLTMKKSNLVEYCGWNKWGK